MKCFLPMLALALAACAPPSPTAADATLSPTAAASAARSAGATTTAMANAATVATGAIDSAALDQYHWELSAATDPSGQRIDALLVRKDLPVQLDFADARLRVHNTCNRMSGSYAIHDGQLQVGHLMQTMMACADPALTKLDSVLSELMRGSLQMSVQAGGTAPQLRLVSAQRDTLLFVGRPTAATRYGSRGQTEFLEVAAQTMACAHPLIPAQQCLQVRERHYDANGLRTGTPGAWHPLTQQIEGYTHEAGVRNVLRVQRYAVANPPADGSTVAYVLDMVVESEVMKR